MNFHHIYLFLCANIVAAKVSHYSRCYVEFSLCLTTSIDDNPSTLDDKSKLNRSSAEEWCEANSLKLAIIPDEKFEYATKKFINEDSAELESDVITNGYRYIESSWNWINGRPSAIHPDVIYNTHGYAYVFLSSSGTYLLHDSPATSRRKFICSYVTHNYVCSNGYLKIGIRCYKYRNEEVTWFNARNNCLREGSDLATFENGVPYFTSNWIGNYWIGQRKESWKWLNGNEFLNLRYSNWDDGHPRSTGGDCLCLKEQTGKWTNCDCSQKYRYVCIQATTEMTTEVKTSSSTPMTTVTTHSTLSVGDSTVQFHSTSTLIMDNNFRDEASGNPLLMPKPEDFGMLIGLGVGSACLVILIIVIVVIVCIKNRRSHSVDHEPMHGNSPPPMTYKDDAPNTVYALVVPNDDEPVRSPSEKTPNQTVYAELDLEPKGKITRRASQPVRYPSERTPDQSVYAEVDLLPKRKTLGRVVVGQQESEVYANSLQVDSVYANNAQTKV